MNEDFSQRVLERIEQEQIHPVPRAVIFARRALTLTLLLLSVLCGGLLCSLLILAILQVDLTFLRVSTFGPMVRLLLDYIPMVWILLFALFCVLEVVLLRHETRAYRYSALMVSGFVILGVSLMGLGIYATHLPERFESGMQHRLPSPMQPWMMRRQSHPRPEDGVLFGKIVEVNQEQFSVEGPERDRWQVKPDQTEFLRLPFVRVDQFVLMQGRVTRPGSFEARTIEPHERPAPPPGMMR